ncbi:MAG: dihydrodipicolinate reductase [Deltaproteobacteria bacterium]|nr:dihydrodipicolinate reductase [Deltaproteobacteria bacterium]
MAAEAIRVIQYGVGPIGLKITRYLQRKPAAHIVAAIDSDPQKIGLDIGELAGLTEPLGVKVSGDATKVLRETEAEIVVLTTTSTLQSIQPQITTIVSAGKNVVSSCEELVYPWYSRPELAQQIDDLARRHQVSVLSTGVNPGFLMDFLPLVMTGVCHDIKRIEVERIQNAQQRRIPFQKKIGAGLSVPEFQKKVRGGVLRHVGLMESMHLLAAGVGWRLEEAEESITPVIASDEVVTAHFTVKPGMVVGVRQMASGRLGGAEVISLLFEATVSQANPHDRIIIEGEPRIELDIKKGVNGDIATCAIIVNSIPAVIRAAPGLRTMADVGLVALWR